MRAILFILIAKAYCDTVMYVLAQEWPGSVCKTENCRKEYLGNFDGKRWNMHGLWPNTIDCGQISSCRNEPYNQNSLAAETKALVNLNWNGLYNDSNDFRKHEWEKHGTCYPGPVSQNQYFYLAAKLAEQYNYYNILAHSGIYPDDERPLTSNDIISAFNNYLGSNGKFTFSCARDSNGRFYLAEVIICFTQEFKTRSCSCNSAVQALMSCGKQFYYPMF